MTLNTDLYIHWFRRDLRLDDNPALLAASKKGKVIPLYIVDDCCPERFSLGGASRWWLHHSLESLNARLNNSLVLRKGDALEILEQFVAQHNVRGVYWNRCYDQWSIERDREIKARLADRGIDAQSHNGSLLWEPWQIKKPDGTPYRVFSPFYRKGCLVSEPPRMPVESAENAQWYASDEGSLSIDELELLPTPPTPRWDQAFAPTWEQTWDVGEAGAAKSLQVFLDGAVQDYKKGRDFPAMAKTSRLSPHIAFGEISPHQIWNALSALPSDSNTDHFRSELGWREFSYYLLYHFPEIHTDNFQPKFDGFPWQDNEAFFDAWKTGTTGIPMVDAGMRELWQTGYMHNRVRMVVGSFLVKNLLLHWHRGADWFWDCLLDADIANNSASWQWVAGSGADAAPYFRIFNPVTQGQKFDPEGDYIRHYIPELKDVPNSYLHRPWEAPTNLMQDAGIRLGEDYPLPIIDLKASREASLSAYKSAINPEG